MSAPLLTICICVRDGEAHLDRCLGALAEQVSGKPVSLRVIDHRSTDRTPQLLLAWQSRLGQTLLQVERFDGVGLAAARNQAWRGALTDWVAFIDVDCKVHPGWVDFSLAKIGELEAKGEIAAFGGMNTVPRDGRLIYRALTLLLSSYVGGHSSVLNRNFSVPCFTDHLPTLNVVYRRGALESVAGFDPAFQRVGEDIDLSFRLRAWGYSLLAVPQLQVEHALRPDIGSWARNMFLYGRGRRFYLSRHARAGELKYYVPALAALAYAVGIFMPLALLALCLAHGLVIGVGLLLAVKDNREGLAAWAAALGLTWLTHLCYGTGFLVEWVGLTRLQSRRLKSSGGG